ncbi:MAG: hypothetical protein ACYCSI_05965 [Solirubrobacteraceae bacterium]
MAVASLLLAALLPASASATVTEVGLISKTEPETVPSCTAGPLGATGLAIEAEKKKAEEAEHLKATEEEKKKKEAERKKREAERKKKKKTTKKATKKTARKARLARRSALSARRTRTLGGSAQAVRTLRPNGAFASAAAATTEATKTTEATSTTPEEGATKTEAPCLAISRTTGFQTQVGSIANPLVLPHNGRIVAWTIDLGRPTPTQIKFFDENEGGAAEAGIAILAPEKTPKLTYKLVAQSRLYKLQSFFGLNVQLPLEQTIKAKAGDVVALSVPTWAPALALGFEKTTAWRASREEKACSVTNTETAQVELKSKAIYACQYLTARLAYSATEISTP